MQESCQAALSWLKSNAGVLFASHFEKSPTSSHRNLQTDDGGGRDVSITDVSEMASSVIQIFKSKDLHVHFPAGGVPKDGPSAGCAITAALTSLWLDRNVRSDTSMTGEISLRGSVLPVGGIKSKVLAAHREGIRRVVLPKRNKKDASDIPKDVLKDLTIIFVDTIEDMLDAVLEGGLSGRESPNHMDERFSQNNNGGGRRSDSESNVPAAVSAICLLSNI